MPGISVRWGIVIMVKSANVPQKYFFCLDLYLTLFLHPHLKRKDTSNNDNITAWLSLVTGTRGKPKQHGNYGRKITAS